MSESASRLEEALDFLMFARQGTIGEAENIPDDRWDYRPHPEGRSVEEIVRHMIEAAAMLLREAADPEGDFSRRSPDEHRAAHGPELRDEMTPTELRDLLATSHEESVRRIREAGEELMSSPIRRFDGQTWTRLTYVYYAASHESYHCGQLAILARAMGLVPALTKKIRGADAK